MRSSRVATTMEGNETLRACLGSIVGETLITEDDGFGVCLTEDTNGNVVYDDARIGAVSAVTTLAI